MSSKSNKKKNILMVVVDCLRADFVYQEKAKIPNISKIVKEGFAFHNTITSATITTPSFSALLTGQYPFENGVRSHSGYTLGKDIKTFPEILQENGYHTYAEMTGPLVNEIGLLKGFDEYNHRDRKKTIHTDWGNEFIDKVKNHYQGPWFTMLHIWPLHHPRKVIPECDNKESGYNLYARALASIDVYLGKLFKELGDDTIIILTGDHGEYIAESPFDSFQKKMRLRFFKFMLKQGLTNKPISKGMRSVHMGHGYGLYDILVRVPFVLHNKDLILSGETETQIRQIDMLPTVADAVGIPSPKKISGKSAFPMMSNKDTESRDAYMEAIGIVLPRKDDWIAALRIDNKYKFIYAPFREDFEEELYDLEKDPNERKNIASKNPELIGVFRKKIEDLKTTEMVGEKINEDDEKQARERLKALGYMD